MSLKKKMAGVRRTIEFEQAMDSAIRMKLIKDKALLRRKKVHDLTKLVRRMIQDWLDGKYIP